MIYGCNFVDKGSSCCTRKWDNNYYYYYYFFKFPLYVKNTIQI